MLTAALHDDQHPLLGLGEHDLIGVHPLLATGHLSDIDHYPAATSGGALHSGTGEPGSAQILQANDPVGVGELKAGLDEQLLEEGISHLNCGSELSLLLEGARSQS